MKLFLSISLFFGSVWTAISLTSNQKVDVLHWSLEDASLTKFVS